MIKIPVGVIVIANDGLFYCKTLTGFVRVVASWKKEPPEVPDSWMEQLGIMEIPDQE